MRNPSGVCLVVVGLALARVATGQVIVSGNENKIDLVSGTARVVPDAAPDSLTVMDWGVSPPSVRHVDGIPNSVIGPPTNIALTPDENLALVASSVRLDPTDPAGFVPDDVVRVVDLRADPPSVIGTVRVGSQPSGISVRGAGDLALVANRADGTVSVLSLEGSAVSVRETVQVGEAGDEICDVAFTPDGRRAIATNRTRGLVHFLKVEDGRLEAFAEPVTAYGRPYHGEITPDGTLALVAGDGSGWGAGAITVVDLEADPIHVVQVQVIGTSPESFSVSPDGRLVAAALINGSNRAPGDPLRTGEGRVVLLSLDGKTLRKIHELPTGPIPEGITFSPDGGELLVQYHPDRVIQVFSVVNGRLEDSGRRIEVPGQPSAMRAVEYPARVLGSGRP